ncbi:MAG: hypothetical protein M9893_12630 [Pyrinomonadaceae bacterium]|nr:hypothetical protein [Pyrinomonadaceae bacterium]
MASSNSMPMALSITRSTGGLGANGDVLAIVMQGEKILIGGNFSGYNGSFCRYGG